MSTDSKNNVTGIDGHEDKNLESLYQQAGKPEPSAELDARILQAAREARDTKPVHKRQTYPWFAGIAASVLVATVVIQIYPESVPDMAAYSPEPDSDNMTQMAKEKASMSRETSASGQNVSKRPATVTPSATVESLSVNKKMASRSPAADTTATLDTVSDPGAAAEPSPSFSSVDRQAGAGMRSQSFADEEVAMPARMTADTPANTADISANSKAEDLQKQIHELIDEGKTGQAEELYRKLIDTHPDFEIDAEIKQLFEPAIKDEP